MWYAEELCGAEFLRGRFADFAYDVHTHETASLVLITSGAMALRLRGATIVARAGDMLAINPDEPHDGWPVDATGWSLRSIHVDIERLRGLLDDDAGRPAAASTFDGPIIRDPALTSLFVHIHRGSEVAGLRFDPEAAHLAFAERLFGHHAGHAPVLCEPGREDRAVHLAREFLDHSLDRKVRLADIADAANLPPFRLFRAFERATGMSPHGYQRQARIRLAAELIRYGRTLGESPSRPASPTRRI
jgi:AraC-like DNA-binding protein